MIKHVVVWKLKNKADAPALKTSIEDLMGQIPGLLSIEAGIDINNWDISGDLILISTHEDRDALAVYQSHPVHVELKDRIIPAVNSTNVVDFEI
jgi:hypothetical protein